MRDIARYLMENYYPKYKGKQMNIVPDEPSLLRALDLHKDKVIVVMKGDQINGVAVFLTLTDETFKNIDTLDLSDVEILGHLLQETGENMHFILLAASGVPAILEGMDYAKKKLRPKTVSWWNPAMNKLHKFNLN